MSIINDRTKFIDFVYDMYLQNVNGRETYNDMFRLGIESAYDEFVLQLEEEQKLKTKVDNHIL